MREQYATRPLPEGNHGQPEGAKEERRPLILLHEHAKAVFDNDPDVRVIRRGSKSLRSSSGNDLIANAVTQNPTGQGEILFGIHLSEQLPDGTQEPRGHVYIDSDGVLKRDNSAIERLALRRSLDEYEREHGLRQLDPLTGEESPSAERMRMERERIDEIDEKAAVFEELGLTVLSDQEAVEFVRLFQTLLPGGADEITLPDNPKIGPQVEQTIEAFKTVTEAIANQNILRISRWTDIDDTTVTLKSTTNLDEDGSEIPHEVTLETLDVSKLARNGMTSRRKWISQPDLFKTGTIENFIFSQTYEAFTPEVNEVNKAALEAHQAHMESPESDATPDQLLNLLLYIDEKATELKRKRLSTTQDDREERGPETSPLKTATGQVDVVVPNDKLTGKLPDEPQVGGESGKSIAEQEQYGQDRPKGKDNGEGKSK